MNLPKKIQLLIIDDSALIREAFRTIIDADPDLEVMGTVESGREGVAKICKLRPDAVIMSLKPPASDGHSTIKKIMARDPVPLIVLSSVQGEEVRKALEIGAVDFVPVRGGIEDIAAALIRKVKIAVRDKPVRERKTVSGKRKKGRKMILLAEDNRTTAALEENILESAGYSVEIANDGNEAIEKAGEERFDLVITDVLMPGMDGFELTQKLKNDDIYRNIPLIIVTTRGKEEDKLKGLRAGADAYILKSEFVSDSFLETIEKLIG